MTIRRRGIILDSGVLQGLAKEPPAHSTLAETLRREATRLVTIQEVMAECIDVPFEVLQRLTVFVEPTKAPPFSGQLLDAFSSGARTVWWSPDPLKRADRAVVGHAIACHYDIATTDRALRVRSFSEFLRRLDHLPDAKLPPWYLPEIIVVRRGLLH